MANERTNSSHRIYQAAREWRRVGEHVEGGRREGTLHFTFMAGMERAMDGKFAQPDRTPINLPYLDFTR